VGSVDVEDEDAERVVEDAVKDEDAVLPEVPLEADDPTVPVQTSTQTTTRHSPACRRAIPHSIGAWHTVPLLLASCLA
jgi:hypothetical protein